MPEFSLVPVDHQPDFSDISFIPVDHDPFSADDIIQQTRAQLESQPQRLTTGTDPPNAGVPANNVEVAASRESYDPDSPNGAPGAGQPYNPSAAPISPSDKLPPFGELKPATYTPTQRIGNTVAEALMGLGMQPYTANDLTSRVGNVLGLSPLGVVGSALDLIDAKRRDDLPGALAAAAGMIPGAKGVARGVAAAEEGAAAIAKGELPANAPTGKYYSVWFETNLGPATYRAPRNAHYQEANENLLQKMEGDADHAWIMQDGGVDLRRTPTGLAPRNPPTGFSWHHADEPGVMQLVPRQQHEWGSIFQGILRPNGRGGYSKWGKPLSSSD